VAAAYIIPVRLKIVFHLLGNLKGVLLNAVLEDGEPPRRAV